MCHRCEQNRKSTKHFGICPTSRIKPHRSDFFFIDARTPTNAAQHKANVVDSLKATTNVQVSGEGKAFFPRLFIDGFYSSRENILFRLFPKEERNVSIIIGDARYALNSEPPGLGEGKNAGTGQRVDFAPHLAKRQAWTATFQNRVTRFCSPQSGVGVVVSVFKSVILVLFACKRLLQAPPPPRTPSNRVSDSVSKTWDYC